MDAVTNSSQGVTTPEQVASRVEVSVVIPCLNEAGSIGICVDKAIAAFAGSKIDGEVVVADNGSTDGSIEIAEQHGARVIHVVARGYGNALRAGIESARGDFIVMGDGDDSYDFTQVPEFVSKWRDGAEFVMGDRFSGGIKPGAMPWHHRYLGTPVMSNILNLFFRTGIRDVNCGMRGFTRDFYYRLGLRTTGMEFASELVIKAAKAGTKIVQIPVTLWPDRRGRPPHLRSFRDGWRHLRFMLLCAPNWLFLVPGGFLFLAGVALVCWLLPGPKVVGHTVIDIHTMLFGMTFAIMGAQIVATGMFAKVFSYAEQFSQNQPSLERWLRRVKLEHGLVTGAVMTLIGGAGTLWLIADWVAADFGPFHHLRSVIFFSLWLCLGVQTIFASFFLSMLGVSRDTYIGDYERQ